MHCLTILTRMLLMALTSLFDLLWLHFKDVLRFGMPQFPFAFKTPSVMLLRFTCIIEEFRHPMSAVENYTDCLFQCCS